MTATIAVTWTDRTITTTLLGELNVMQLGILTTDHAASSYGQPVVVDSVGHALGPAEVGQLTAANDNPDVDAAGSYLPLTAKQTALVEAARAAGYSVRVVA